MIRAMHQRAWIVLVEWGLRGEVRADGGCPAIGSNLSEYVDRLFP